MKPAKHGRDHCPGGEDEIPCLVGTHFASLQNSNGYEHTGADDWIDFEKCWISDGASSYFDYEVSAGTGQLGADRVWILAKESGVYSFSWLLQTADLTVGTWRWQARLKVLGDVAGGTEDGGVTDRFPGQIASTPLIQFREQYDISDAGGDDVWLTRSVTVPIKHPNPGTSYRMGQLKFLYGPTSSMFFLASMWVTRLGNLSWAASDFSAANTTYP